MTSWHSLTTTWLTKLELQASQVPHRLLLKESHRTVLLMEQLMVTSPYLDLKSGRHKREHLYRLFRRMLLSQLPLILLVLLLPHLGTSENPTQSQSQGERSLYQQVPTLPSETLPTQMTSKSSLPQEPMSVTP